MKKAVIKTGGKQYVVKEKDKLKIEKLDSQAGDKVDFDTLLVFDEKNFDCGAPTVASRVEGKVLRAGKSRTVTGIKYKPKTRQAKGFGHRQAFSEVEITKI